MHSNKTDSQCKECALALQQLPSCDLHAIVSSSCCTLGSAAPPCSHHQEDARCHDASAVHGTPCRHGWGVTSKRVENWAGRYFITNQFELIVGGLACGLAEDVSVDLIGLHDVARTTCHIYCAKIVHHSCRRPLCRRQKLWRWIAHTIVCSAALASKVSQAQAEWTQRRCTAVSQPSIAVCSSRIQTITVLVRLPAAIPECVSALQDMAGFFALLAATEAHWCSIESLLFV